MILIDFLFSELTEIVTDFLCLFIFVKKNIVLVVSKSMK